MTASNLVGAKDIADRAGVKVDTIHKWRARHPSFPEPIGLISGLLPVWDYAEVETWLKANGRSPETRTGTR